MNTEVKTAISITDVNKYYGDLHVLKDVNLEVKEGEVLVLLGPSGSGKSTLLRTINGLEEIQGGQVFIHGELYNARKKPGLNGRKRSQVGMVFQQFNLYPHMTVLDNVTLALRKVKKMSKAAAAEVALPMLKKVGLEDKVDCYPAQLSGGEQQRVAIARALVGNPSILLADEPTGALDQKTGKQVMQLFQSLNDEGRTVIMITHDMNVAANARRTVHIIDGELTEGGDAADA